jgi:hypothetical protein
MLCRDDRHTVSDVLKDISAFIFRVNQSKQREYLAPKMKGLLTLRNVQGLNFQEHRSGEGRVERPSEHRNERCGSVRRGESTLWSSLASYRTEVHVNKSKIHFIPKKTHCISNDCFHVREVK